MCSAANNISKEDAEDEAFWGPVIKDGKSTPVASTSQFLMTAAAIPVLATTVLPLSIVYQLLHAITKPLHTKKPPPILDTGYVVKDGDIIPRPKRKYDLVILGATGFTGKLAVRHMAKTYGVNSKVKWAIAGRNQTKLDQVKGDLADELGIPDLKDLDTINVDTSKAETMPDLVRNTRAVATTAGPFFKYGSPVVEFCAKFGTHYADITGEPTWIQQMMATFEDTAKASGAKIISLCGHDCIPWDLAVMMVSETLKRETGEDVAEFLVRNELLSQGSGGTLATLQAAISGEIINAPRKNPFYAKADSPSTKTANNVALSIISTTHPRTGEKLYGGPFIMALVNHACVSWSQALRKAGKSSYREFSIYPDFKTSFCNFVGLGGFLLAMTNPLTAKLLADHVLPKPGEGPSIRSMENKFFGTIHCEGTGTNGSKAEALVYFPKCVGYMETARMVTESALCMALQEKELPEKEGGFYTPSTGLGNVLVGRLEKTGTHFATRLRSKL